MLNAIDPSVQEVLTVDWQGLVGVPPGAARLTIPQYSDPGLLVLYALYELQGGSSLLLGQLSITSNELGEAEETLQIANYTFDVTRNLVPKTYQVAVTFLSVSASYQISNVVPLNCSATYDNLEGQLNIRRQSR